VKTAAQLVKDAQLESLHWWDDHPPADPRSEPVYADALRGHLAQLG